MWPCRYILHAAYINIHSTNLTIKNEKHSTSQHETVQFHAGPTPQINKQKKEGKKRRDRGKGTKESQQSSSWSSLDRHESRG